MREEHRHEDQDVLGPLVKTDRLEPGLERRRRVDERPDGRDLVFAKGGLERAGGIRDHGIEAVGEQGRIWKCVADVSELVAKSRLKGCQLVFTGEVCTAVGGEDAGKQAEVRGDPIG